MSNVIVLDNDQKKLILASLDYYARRQRACANTAAQDLECKHFVNPSFIAGAFLGVAEATEKLYSDINKAQEITFEGETA